MYRPVEITSELITNSTELQLTIRMLGFAKEAGYTNVWDKQHGSTNYTDYLIDDAIKMLETGDLLTRGYHPSDFDEGEIDH